MLSTRKIHKCLSLSPKQKIRLKWSTGLFVLGTTVSYVIALSKEEYDHGFALSAKGLFDFLQQAAPWLVPTSFGFGAVCGYLGDKWGERIVKAEHSDLDEFLLLASPTPDLESKLLSHEYTYEPPPFVSQPNKDLMQVSKALMDAVTSKDNPMQTGVETAEGDSMQVDYSNNHDATQAMLRK